MLARQGQTGVVSAITVSRVTEPNEVLPTSSQLPTCLRTSQRSNCPALGEPWAEMFRVVQTCELLSHVIPSK